MARPIHRALISVSDKAGLENFARQLRDHGVEILSTGGTYRALEAAWQGAGEATARLRLRRRASLAGTQVHPADLDGALQSTALLRRGGGGCGEGW